MTHITPEQFRDAFLLAVSEDESELLKRWELPVEGLDYTSFIQYKTLPKLEESLALSYRAEYKKIDGVYFSNDFPEGSTNPTCVSVALEHEGDIRTSFNEINALQLYNAPLKVLITYTPGPPEFPQAESETIRNNYLNAYLPIIQNADICGDFETYRRQLIVIGRILRVEDQYKIEWHSYIYRRAGFKEI